MREAGAYDLVNKAFPGALCARRSALDPVRRIRLCPHSIGVTREIHAVIAREPIRRGARLISKEFGVRVMQVLGRHWLDYDPVALAVLFVGLGAVSLLAWSI